MSGQAWGSGPSTEAWKPFPLLPSAEVRPTRPSRSSQPPVASAPSRLLGASPVCKTTQDLDWSQLICSSASWQGVAWPPPAQNPFMGSFIQGSLLWPLGPALGWPLGVMSRKGPEPRAGSLLGGSGDPNPELTAGNIVLRACPGPPIPNSGPRPLRSVRVWAPSESSSGI